MYEKLRRSYKTISPGETVANIRRILGEIGFETRPVNQLNPYNGIYSLSIFLEGLGVTTHGKGHNRELALASGYAEFMERLQNSTVKLLTAQRLNPYQNLHSKYNFYLYPDEKELTKAEFENTINEIIAANFANNKKEKDNYRTAAMFYKNRVVKGKIRKNTSSACITW